MRHVVTIPPFGDARTILDLGVLADQAGWDAVLIWDHLQWDVDLRPPVHDPWAILSALAVVTDNVVLGTGVTPLSRRRPHIVAKQLVTLDHLSAGRALLGVGLGVPQDADFEAFGDIGDPRTRAKMLDESLKLIDHLVRGNEVSHHGEHYDIEAQLLPPSLQKPRPPIVVAGTAPNRAPLVRSLSWDGFFPLGSNHLLTPPNLALYLEGTERPDGWQLWAPQHPDFPPDDHAAVGVDWLVQGTWPGGDWVPEFRNRIAAGPPS